jgi:hypothetical protein
MPRRRAVRVIGVSLAALAVPGVSPRIARAATALHSQTETGCPRGFMCCFKGPDSKGNMERKICGYPIQQYQCNGLQCLNTCPPFNEAAKQRQRPTWSSAEFPDGRPQRYNCCPVPDTIPKDGDCIPDCRRPEYGRASFCGRTCCPKGQRCKRPSTGECVACPRNRPACGSTCCKPGQECSQCKESGSDFSQRSDYVNRTDREKCCAPNEHCCRNTCCKDSTHCCGAQCCPVATTRCARADGRDICCPKSRAYLNASDISICCPRGTVPVGRKGCCPPGDPNCCPPQDGLGNTLDCRSLGQICVRGACVNP